MDLSRFAKNNVKWAAMYREEPKKETLKEKVSRLEKELALKISECTKLKTLNEQLQKQLLAECHDEPIINQSLYNKQYEG